MQAAPMNTADRVEQAHVELLQAERALRKLMRAGDALADERTPATVAAWRQARVDAGRLMWFSHKPR